ncbi:MAG: hypothetical protein HY880_07195 [Deltaproteobacteria bacterium]|nr:hypothetical protein [Deltaproteobacteria bacterium]
MGLFTWQGWLMWALLITLLGLWHPPTHDIHAPVDPKRKLISGLTLMVFILTFIPTPFYIV